MSADRTNPAFPRGWHAPDCEGPTYCGSLFRCKGCSRVMGACQGCADHAIAYCDDCVYQESLTSAPTPFDLDAFDDAEVRSYAW